MCMCTHMQFTCTTHLYSYSYIYIYFKSWVHTKYLHFNPVPQVNSNFFPFLISMSLHHQWETLPYLCSKYLLGETPPSLISFPKVLFRVLKFLLGNAAASVQPTSIPQHTYLPHIVFLLAFGLNYFRRKVGILYVSFFLTWSSRKLEKSSMEIAEILYLS